MNSLARIASELGGAVGFLTRCPVPRRFRSGSFGASTFPLVGLALGGAAVAIDGILAAILPPLRDVGIIVFWGLASGALHYDGLADTLDGLGGLDREERLRIMKDGSIGTFGTLGIVIAVAAKLSALAALAGGDRIRALVLAPALGRWAMLLAALGPKPARSEGLGAAFVAALSPGEVAVATGFAVSFAVVTGGLRGLLACLAAAAIAVGARTLAVRRFGGVSGDVLGACGEIVETMVLALLAVGDRA